MKKLIFLLIFLAPFISSAQDGGAIYTDTLNINSIWGGWTLTRELTFRSDTTALKIIYIDKLDYLKYAKGISVESGWGDESMIGFYDHDYQCHYFIRIEKVDSYHFRIVNDKIIKNPCEEYVEIERDKIIIAVREGDNF